VAEQYEFRFEPKSFWTSIARLDANGAPWMTGPYSSLSLGITDVMIALSLQVVLSMVFKQYTSYMEVTFAGTSANASCTYGWLET
jgi:hypothetical protein